MVQPAALAPDQRAWQARLTLGFERRKERTVLADCRHTGPLRVQRPFYPEGAPSHVYVLHPPGGVVGGDDLVLDVRLNAGAQALLTTPASSKFYRSDGRCANQQQLLRAGADAILEWLPQDNIIFNGCLADLSTRVQLASTARFVGWEMFTLGRPACGERFETGELRQRLEVWRDELPLLIERACIGGGAPLLSAAWGLQQKPTFGTLLATPADANMLALARAALTDRIRAAGIAFTLKGDLLIGRGLAEHAHTLQRAFIAVWSAIRPQLAGRPACAPRIWST